MTTNCPICGDPTHPEGRCPLNPDIHEIPASVRTLKEQTT